MGEKLNAFISLYSLKAKEEVEKWKTKTAEDEVKWKKLTDELYPAALKTATDLKQLETFQQIFPSPGTYIENITKYGSLLGTDPDFAKQLKELYKWRNTKTQIANRKKYLAEATEYVNKGGEDYLTRLVKEISSKLVGTTLAVALFKSYPDYIEYIEELIEHVPGPDGVLTTPEIYAALLEKRDAGAFPAGAGNVSDASVTGAKPPTETNSSSTLNEPMQSAKPTESAKTEGMPASSINSSTDKKESVSTETKSPINTTAPSKSETISTTSLDGGVTSKTGELQTENILETDPSKAISINLENKPIESKPAAGSTSNSSTTSTTSNSSTTVNDVSSASSVTGNLLNTSTNTGVTSNENIMKVENTTNQSSSGTVNENKPEKEKGGFLSKVGNFAKKAGAVLNLPSIGTLGEQAKGLFGAAGANISSRISEVTNSFAINSSEAESNASPTSSTTTNSVNSSNTSTNTAPNVLAVPNTSAVSNTENLLKTETQNSMNVEQKLPGVTATAIPAPVVSAQIAPVASTVVSNAVNSQTGSSPQTTNTTTAQNIQAAGQPASTPPGMGVNVDMNQLAQSIMRLERILISGIDVTIKDA